jgi:hypothetical protein
MENIHKHTNGHAPPPEVDPRVTETLGIFADLEAIKVAPGLEIAASEVLCAGQVPVRRPQNDEFVRVLDDPAYMLSTAIYTDKASRETYMVTPTMRPHIIAGLNVRLLCLAVNQNGQLFIWSVPTEELRQNAWNDTQRAGFHRAKTEWIKLVADQAMGHYRVYRAEGKLHEPVFPVEKPFNEILALAFNNRVIDNIDHPIIKAMRGIV